MTSSRQGVLTDRSLALTAGNTAQTLAAANPQRKYLLIQNNSATGEIWVDFNATAVQTQPSIRLATAAVLIFEDDFVPIGAVSVIGPTAGQPVTCKEG